MKGFAAFVNCHRALIASNKEFGLQVLTNVVEIEYGNVPCMRILAALFEQLSLVGYAVSLYSHILKLRQARIALKEFLLFFLGRKNPNLTGTWRLPSLN